MTCPIQGYSSLHGHSHFSLMDAICTPEEIVLAAKAKGLKSIALTDHGVMHGVAQMYMAGKKHGVKTVYGMEAYCVGSLAVWQQASELLQASKKNKKKKSTESQDVDQILEEEEEEGVLTEEELNKIQSRALKKKGHLVLLARNRQGLSDLFNLSYLAHRDGFYFKPRADKDMLAVHAGNIVASTACMGGVVSNKCWEFSRNEIEWKDVVKEAEEYQEVLGKGNFFLELQFNKEPGQAFINECMVNIHKETGIPLTVTTDFHYIKPSDWEVQDVLYMMRAKPVKTFTTRGDKWHGPVPGLYVKNHEEMWQSYLSYGQNISEDIAKQAFENTLLIDSMIDHYEPDTRVRLPTLPIAEPFKELVVRAFDELKRRELHKKEEYVQRLYHELKIIKDKGFANYFLITQEIIQKAKERMLVGPARGSAAGSLLCYVLNITDLDPLEHGLLFERFLNPDRKDLPDIDTDYQNPDDVKEMLREQFGKDNVACISTFHTFNVKGLLKDLGRIHDMDHKVLDGITARIDTEMASLKGPEGLPPEIPIEMATGASPTLKQFLNDHPNINRYFVELYGKNRHLGRHAAGVVIGDDLPHETAVVTSKGVVQSSFTQGQGNSDLAAMGLVKHDILKLDTLEVIDHAVKLISNTTGKSYKEIYESLRPCNLNLNDQKVLKHVFHDGNFCGIFQYSKKGIQRLAMQLKPTCFDDIVALGAIYRPPALHAGMDEMYVKGKQDPSSIKYDHPILKEILEPTMGCMIYQEQVMATAHKLGKMTLPEAEKLRKLISKKQSLKEMEDKFIAGCIENGFPEEKARKLYEDMKGWSGYGFNKSHAAAYAVNTYQTAWLATYYPLEFYAAVLTCAKAGEKQEYVDEIRRLGYKVLPVSINHSKADTVIEGDGIRLSLSLVKGVGDAVIPKIVENQPYENPIDFLFRSKATKTAVMPLVNIGSFSDIDPNLKRVQKRLELYFENAQKYKSKKGWEKYVELYHDPSFDILEDYAIHEKMAMEHELLGFSTSGSPFKVLGRDVKLEAMKSLFTHEYDEIAENTTDKDLTFPIVLKAFREKQQRKGGMMAYLTFGTLSGREFEAPCFAGLWQHLSSTAKIGGVYLVSFCRDLKDNPLNLKVGRSDRYWYNKTQAETVFIDIDGVSL